MSGLHRFGFIWMYVEAYMKATGAGLNEGSFLDPVAQTLLVQSQNLSIPVGRGVGHSL
jgi:phosphopantetheinyl transferase